MSVATVIRSGFLFPTLSREERAERVRDARKRIDKAEERRRENKRERISRAEAKREARREDAKRDRKS